MVSFTTAEEAVKVIQSGHRVFLHGGAATPHHLIAAMRNRASELRNVELVSISLQGGEIVTEELRESFFVNSLFVSDSVRGTLDGGNGDYVPVFLSEIPRLFRQGYMPLDVALVMVSPPDKHGYCSLGTSVDVAGAALKYAHYVIAQVNPRLPRTHGDGLVHMNQLDAMVWKEAELPEIAAAEISDPISQRIGKFVAGLVDDGATLQTGIGSIPDAVLASLTNHKNLGLHTEMFSDGVLPLLKNGTINNSLKRKHVGKVVTGFLMGSRKLYDFVDDNPMVQVLNIDYVNDTSVIRTNPKVTAINSAIEVDITGQICADSIGRRQYSGVGGQMDFMRGAALSEGGKPIIALPSTTRNGESRIVPVLKPGASVTTTRAHVHYIATEYGIAHLYGKNLRQRAKALIEIAHPNHREALEREAFERFQSYEFERVYF